MYISAFLTRVRYLQISIPHADVPINKREIFQQLIVDKLLFVLRNEREMFIQKKLAYAREKVEVVVVVPLNVNLSFLFYIFFQFVLVRMRKDGENKKIYTLM